MDDGSRYALPVLRTLVPTNSTTKRLCFRITPTHGVLIIYARIVVDEMNGEGTTGISTGSIAIGARGHGCFSGTRSVRVLGTLMIGNALICRDASMRGILLA